MTACTFRQNKQYGQQIGLVPQQYSRGEHGLVRGIGIVNLVHNDEGDFYPIDYRICAKQVDGRTKNELFGEMLIAAKDRKGIKAHMVLFGSWYASVDNLKLIAFLKAVFITSVKDNRLMSLSKDQGYSYVQNIHWITERFDHGVSVKLKELSYRVQLFKAVAPNGDTDQIIINYPGPVQARSVQDRNAQCSQFKQFHRELKQMTGAEKRQCRKAHTQRNHLGYCYWTWFSLKVRQRIFDDFLTAVLQTSFGKLRQRVFELNA